MARDPVSPQEFRFSDRTLWRWSQEAQAFRALPTEEEYPFQVEGYTPKAVFGAASLRGERPLCFQ